MAECSICGGSATFFRLVDSYEYFDCRECASIAIGAAVVGQIDAGEFVRDYNENYWREETRAAHERSWGDALARCAEVMLYARKPIERFLDIGTGPGFLLDSLSFYMPNASHRFYGVEKFPPPEHSKHQNYMIGDLADISGVYQAGCCIEVVEHLTPAMMRRLAEALARRSERGSIFIFNSANPNMVRTVVPDYLDPLRRGHIISWGMPALQAIFEPHGFSVSPIRGKDFAFIVEYGEPAGDPQSRIWSPVHENHDILSQSGRGSLMYLLGLETARAYG